VAKLTPRQKEFRALRKTLAARGIHGVQATHEIARMFGITDQAVRSTERYEARGNPPGRPAKARIA
jgi:DNA-directed RNA polymerase sigma subunit (sigma70/sigma32)